MLKVCPGCGRLVTVETEVTTCPYCGEEIRVPVEELAVVRPQEGGYSPWDERDRLGAFRAYWLTWRQVIGGPSGFFARLPVDRGIAGPLLFGLVTLILGNLAGLFWQSVFYSSNEMLQALMEEVGISPGSVLQLAVFLMPVYVVVQLFLWSGILHLMILLLARGGRGFEATFRVVAFSSAPALLYVVPFCGGLLASVWSAVLTIIGLREVHRVSGAVAALAVIIPLFTCLGMLMIGLYAGLSTLSSL